MSRGWAKRRAGRSLVVLSALALFVSTTTASAETLTDPEVTEESATTAQPQLLVARDVTTVPARDMRLARPVAIAYDAAAGAFIVSGDTSSGSATVRVPESWNPAEVTDGADGSLLEGADLTAVNPQDGLRYELSSDGTRLDAYDGSSVVAIYDASSAGLTAPTSMTFGPSSDLTDPSENQNLFVADEDGVTQITLQQEPTGVQSADLVSPTSTHESATLIQSIDTSTWTEPSTDPSGIVWDSRVDELIVVDSEVNETTLFAGVNLWRINRSGTVLSTGTTTGYSDEPTGAGLQEATDTLFITDDTGTKGLYAVTAGSDGILGTSDDIGSVIDLGSLITDPEEPVYHVNEGVVYLLGGADTQVVRVDPVDGVFANGDDVITSFDISHLGPTDFEGMTHAPNRGTLYVGARNGNSIFEITTSGTLVRTIDVNIAGMSNISGLTMAPSSTDPTVLSLWSADRAADEVNDGMIFELGVPNLDDPGS
ncbi:MAG: hypothetical protein R3324_11470, partial [Halobacteriales archaeon]|nr:hypothetical protein [Halobacteriales archaeon]